jgi:hypothetical protein
VREEEQVQGRASEALSLCRRVYAQRRSLRSRDREGLSQGTSEGLGQGANKCESESGGESEGKSDRARTREGN